MIRFIFLFLLLTTVSIAHAIDVVFRQDTRPPAIIFEHGFQPLGDDDDILNHIEGISCLSGRSTSAFVATTTDQSVAVGMGRDVQQGEAFWVYSIRPSDNFYSAYNSLMYAYSQTNINIFRETAQTFAPQREYMAFAGIASEQIIGGWLYRSHGLHTEPVRLSYSENPYYLPENTDVNPNPYTRYHIPSPSSSLTTCESCISHVSSITGARVNIFTTTLIQCKRFTAIMLSQY
ncbi:scabin-related ADP-ribosyltransferase [Serratia marcescens]|uniref:scabin-related ADP-ribosyltransferase n=1 Tax=Serratia marcescens TaxID=615 RepID=UPI0009409099|nr:hypothetical protein [Serratia marcescens]